MTTMNLTNSKRYSELNQLKTFEERFDYLKLKGSVGQDTFGYDRYLNQEFYKSKEWRDLRNYIIARDGGCDLGIKDRPITGPIYIHHINPLAKEDILSSSDALLDPNNLICVSMSTHNAIHYSDDSILKRNEIVERKPNDMCPWK